MLKIHHLIMSRSDRIVWLAEELGVPYELVRHHRDPQTFRAPESLRAITWLAKAPVIQDEGLTIAESAVICDYILDRYGNGRLRPAAGTPERLQYAYWMHSAESSLMLPVLIDTLSTLTQSDAPGMLAFASGEFKTMFGYLELTLANHDYLVAGEFSAADVMVYYTVALGAGAAIPGFKARVEMAEYPGIQAYLSRLEQRPAWGKAKQLCAS